MTRWCGVLFVPATLGAQAAARVTVGPNVHVSAARPNDIHDEVLIAGDPFDASHLLACSTFLPASWQWGGHNAVHARNWRHGFLHAPAAASFSIHRRRTDLEPHVPADTAWPRS